MTLIFTAVDKGRIVQVSDRRLTWPNGEKHDDNANKGVCIDMDCVHFATSYTGLAYVGGVRKEDRTDYWLVENLGDIARNGKARIEDICNALAERAADTLSGLAVENKGLTFVMAGYEGDDRPFRATVSNMRRKGDPSDVRGHFISEVRRFYPWDSKPALHTAGAVAIFETKGSYGRALKRIRLMIEKHLKKRGDKLDELQVAQVLVSLVGAATTHPTFGHLVSKKLPHRTGLPVEGQPTWGSIDELRPAKPERREHALYQLLLLRRSLARPPRPYAGESLVQHDGHND